MADEIVAAVTVTADGAIAANDGWYYGCRITGDGTNSARVILYDNASAASGTVVDELRCGANESRGGMLENPVRLQNGLYADVTTVGRVVAWVQK